MGQIADDMIDGAACQCCGCYFIDENEDIYEHGHAVTCWDCWDDLTPQERKGHKRADVQTI